MKNFNNREDEFIRSLLSEVDTDSPSGDFHLKILSKIERRNSIVYQPLIPPMALKFIVAGIILLVLITLFFVPGVESSLTYWDKIPDIAPSILNITLPKITFPKINLGPIVNTSLLAFSLLMILWVIYSSKRLNVE